MRTRFIHSRHSSVVQKTALMPLFIKRLRDARGRWKRALLIRLNGILFVELAAMSLAILLKANDVRIDDAISCEAGVGVQVRGPLWCASVPPILSSSLLRCPY